MAEVSLGRATVVFGALNQKTGKHPVRIVQGGHNGKFPYLAQFISRKQFKTGSELVIDTKCVVELFDTGVNNDLEGYLYEVLAVSNPDPKLDAVGPLTNRWLIEDFRLTFEASDPTKAISDDLRINAKPEAAPVVEKIKLTLEEWTSKIAETRELAKTDASAMGTFMKTYARPA